MSPRAREWSPLPLRIMLGIGCVHHGWHNVIMADERQAFLWMLGELGMAHAGTMLWLISAVSFAGGLALLSGAFVRPACIALAINVPAILLLIHAPSGFDFVKLTAVTARGPQYGMPGYEVGLLYLAGLFSLFLVGAGPLSIDRVRARRRRGVLAALPKGTWDGDRELESAGTVGSTRGRCIAAGTGNIHSNETEPDGTTSRRTVLLSAIGGFGSLVRHALL